MSSNVENGNDDGAANVVIKDAVRDGQIGVGIWNRMKKTFTLSEKITNYPAHTFHSLSDFIEKIALKRDRLFALDDLKEYLENPSGVFRSTFRIQTKDGQYKWLLVKGKIDQDEHTGDELFKVIFYDVSGDNFESGNDKETNLLNRDFFIKKLEWAVQCNDKGANHALIGINVTNYQSILDNYGTAISTPLFKTVSKTLQCVFDEDCEIAKLTTENFAVLMYDIMSREELKQLTVAVTSAFKEPLAVDEQRIRIEVSLGVTVFPKHASSVSDLMLAGEYATWQSKQSGKYQTTFFTRELSDTLQEHLLVESKIADALSNQEFYLMYQPQIDSSTGRIIGVEALARWTNDKLGAVSPGVFIPIAEKQGYLIELGDFILKENIQTAKSWLRNGYDFGSISINISPVELGKSDFVEKMIALCERYNLPKTYLELEITEGVYMQSIEKSLGVVRKLIEKGFKIAVDDFGTGYSNLAFLSQAKLTTLKIDKSLIDQLDRPAGRLIVESIVKLGKSLGYHVLAEGVETKEQVDLLAEMNCHRLQGYYYSRPLMRTEMESMLERGYLQH